MHKTNTLYSTIGPAALLLYSQCPPVGPAENGFTLAFSGFKCWTVDSRPSGEQITTKQPPLHPQPPRSEYLSVSPNRALCSRHKALFARAPASPPRDYCCCYCCCRSLVGKRTTCVGAPSAWEIGKTYACEHNAPARARALCATDSTDVYCLARRDRPTAGIIIVVVVVVDDVARAYLRRCAPGSGISLCRDSRRLRLRGSYRCAFALRVSVSILLRLRLVSRDFLSGPPHSPIDCPVGLSPSSRFTSRQTASIQTQERDKHGLACAWLATPTGISNTASTDCLTVPAHTKS